MNVNTLKRILLTRKIELFLSSGSGSIERPGFDWGYCCQSEAGWASPKPEPELWPPPRLQLALLRFNNQARALPAALPAGKYFSTISKIIWRAEPKICEAICYECSSLVNTHTSDGGLFEHFLWQMQSSSFMVCGCQDWWRTDRVQNLFTSAQAKMRPTQLFVAMCANLHFAKCKTHFV